MNHMLNTKVYIILSAGVAIVDGIPVEAGVAAAGGLAVLGIVLGELV